MRSSITFMWVIFTLLPKTAGPFKAFCFDKKQQKSTCWSADTFLFSSISIFLSARVSQPSDCGEKRFFPSQIDKALPGLPARKPAILYSRGTARKIF